MWQTKYALAVPKNLGLGFNFRLCSEGYFLTERPYSVPWYTRARFFKYGPITLVHSDSSDAK